ncbi:hypothetical protein SAMN05216174_104304 [Actinokineospora iranica]|uniref:Uncharacterized protein n=2 Tax=Actinokineospora iranica TaxID=1271860 RepID=A0A1G6PHB2_9PSEU|nr:hypothetical protein SAMN05216174_104304 [Actinokineospora iranica]
MDARVTGDGGLTRWDSADIGRLLLEWFPRKVTLERSEWSGALATLHCWVDFLAATRRGDVRDLDALHAVIDRSAPEFQVRMTDERNYGLAKFWMTRMIEHDVDIADEDAVRGFLRAVQVGEIDYDQDVLGEIMGRRALEGEADLVLPEFEEHDPGPLPPALVPPEGELASLAESAIAVARFRTLVAWVGAGRALTTTKRLRVADARELALLLGVDAPYLERARSSADLPEVSLLVAWARAARLVRVVKGRLLAVKSAAGLLDRPLDLWWRAFEAFGELGPEVCAPASRYEGPSLLAQVLPEVALDLWLSLYTAGGTPVPVELLAGSIREMMSALLGFGIGGPLVGIREMMWRRDLAAVLAALQTVGAVELTVSADAQERDKIIELSGDDDPDLTLARLTPLGLWGARRALRAEGFDAPSVAELAEAPLKRVCEVVEHCAPEVVESVLETWVASRDAKDAAAELAAFCVNGPSSAARLLAWAALEHTGMPGVDQARRLRSEGGVAGGMATEWLVSHGELAPEAAEQPEMLLALSENMAAMHDHGMLIEEMTGHPLHDQLGFVHAIASARHPDRIAMLTTISRDHPGHGIAAAADEALGGGLL